MVGFGPDFTQTLPRTGRSYCCIEIALLAIVTITRREMVGIGPDFAYCIPLNLLYVE